MLAAAWWLGHTTARWPRPVFVVLAVASLVTWCWLLVEVLQRRVALIFDFELTRNPLYRLWRLVLPDYRRLGAGGWTLHAMWIVVVGLAALAGWRSMALRPEGVSAVAEDEDASAGEGADADWSGRRGRP